MSITLIVTELIRLPSIFRINVMRLRHRNEIQHRNIDGKRISSVTINVIDILTRTYQRFVSIRCRWIFRQMYFRPVLLPCRITLIRNILISRIGLILGDQNLQIGTRDISLPRIKKQKQFRYITVTRLCVLIWSGPGVLQARRNRDLFCLFVYKYFGSKEMMMKIPAWLLLFLTFNFGGWNLFSTFTEN